MLKGIDVSHHNNLEHILSIIDKPDFCFIKATEGKTFNDPHFKKNVELCQERDIPIGFYHFARPENNPAVIEAIHFLNKIRPYIGNCLIALDWEEKALNYPVTWALEFLDYIYKETGVRPLIYCSAWYTSKLAPIRDKNYGLWVAHYTHQSKPNIGVYGFWAFWQYATPTFNRTNPHENVLCDYNYFNGSIGSLHAYMAVEQKR